MDTTEVQSEVVGLPTTAFSTNKYAVRPLEVVEHMKVTLFACFVLLTLALVPLSLSAQVAEINPYGGFYWPSNNTGVGSFANNQLLGIRGGGYITPNFELGANWAWSNRFQPSNSNLDSAFAGALGFPQGPVRSNLFEVEFTYNFGKQTLFGAAVRPYLVAGGGALRTSVKDTDAFVLNTRAVDTPNGVLFVPNDVLNDGDVFFSFSYGGGVKATRLWGPLGFFGDFRGRTIPNFFGHGTNWPELTAGLNFSWGER
jgi:hypothetical protein